MATTFKIHQDDDIAPQTRENKKEFKASGKRCVLGQIQVNAKESFKTYGVKKEVLSLGFTDNIKALDIKDKLKRNTKNVPQITSVRTPLKDMKNDLKINEAKNGHKVLSPMHIESALHNTFDVKENIHHQPSIKPVIETFKKGEENETKRNDLVLASPMSVDVSPNQSLENNSTETLALENIYDSHPYKEDIYKYLRKVEEEYRPKGYYMRRQPDVSYSMRTILVDWLVEVGEEYKLKNETVFMAVSYIDRFLSIMAVAKPKLQLLGISAMFIAAKFEEIYPPEVGEFTYITDDSYTVKQVLRMERLILKVLCFDLSCPTSYTFIMHISSCIKMPSKIIYLAMYICELTLLEADPYLDYCPSLISCGALALARRCLNYTDVWPCDLSRITGYTLYHLRPVVINLNETHHKSFTLPQTAIRHKYSVPEYEHVSEIPFKRLVLRDSSAS